MGGLDILKAVWQGEGMTFESSRVYGVPHQHRQ